MTTDIALAAALDTLPLSQLTHFTPSRNLPHILQDRELRSVADLSESVRSCYSQTDRRRLDGHRDKVCCSLQYPNGFYFDIARRGDGARNYPDWVCLLIDKAAAAEQGTLFCPRNASAGGARPGTDALAACYAPAVVGQGGRTRRRGQAHDPGSPTDVQAEVLLPAPVPLSLVRSIVFPSDAAAREEYGRLDRLGRLGRLPAAPPFAVASGLFDKWIVTDAVTRGVLVTVEPWMP